MTEENKSANAGCLLIIILCLFIGAIKSCGGGGGVGGSADTEIDKIIKAKAIVRSMVNYPDTLSFHNMSTSVSGDNVTLKFTAKNAFGVPSTYTKTITVD